MNWNFIAFLCALAIIVILGYLAGTIDKSSYELGFKRGYQKAGGTLKEAKAILEEDIKYLENHDYPIKFSKK